MSHHDQPLWAPAVPSTLWPQVRDVLKSHPTLDLNGFNNIAVKLRRDDRHQFAEQYMPEVLGALMFVDDLLPRCRRTKPRDGAPSSYWLKHMAEAWHTSEGRSVYVSNGAFLVACILRGVQMHPSGGLNAGIALHRGDVTKNNTRIAMACFARRRMEARA